MAPPPPPPISHLQSGHINRWARRTSLTCRKTGVLFVRVGHWSANTELQRFLPGGHSRYCSHEKNACSLKYFSYTCISCEPCKYRVVRTTVTGARCCLLVAETSRAKLSQANGGSVNKTIALDSLINQAATQLQLKHSHHSEV